MGQAQLNITRESLDPAVLEMIMDALSFGVARSIINSAVEAVTQSAVTDSLDKNSGNIESSDDSLT